MTTKFQTKMDITVEEYHRAIASELVSLVRELEWKLGENEAHEIVSAWAERNIVKETRAVVENLDEPPEDFETIKILLRKWVKDLNENNIEEVSITEETSTHSFCTVTECIHAKVFNDLDARDIGYLLHCKHDFAATPAIHPKLGLKRTKTLMEGDECCNFDYYWVE